MRFKKARYPLPIFVALLISAGIFYFSSVSRASSMPSQPLFWSWQEEWEQSDNPAEPAEPPEYSSALCADSSETILVFEQLEIDSRVLTVFGCTKSGNSKIYFDADGSVELIDELDGLYLSHYGASNALNSLGIAHVIYGTQAFEYITGNVSTIDDIHAVLWDEETKQKLVLQTITEEFSLPNHFINPIDAKFDSIDQLHVFHNVLKIGVRGNGTSISYIGLNTHGTVAYRLMRGRNNMIEACGIGEGEITFDVTMAPILVVSIEAHYLSREYHEGFQFDCYPETTELPPSGTFQLTLRPEKIDAKKVWLPLISR